MWLQHTILPVKLVASVEVQLQTVKSSFTLPIFIDCLFYKPYNNSLSSRNKARIPVSPSNRLASV